MALITFSGGINSEHRVQRWAIQLWHTHQREQFFEGDMLFGKTPNNIIQLKADFTQKAGYQMTEGLIMPFAGAGVVNDEQLEDNEEAPDFYNMTWTISQLRNAGRFAGEETQQMVEYDLPNEIKDGLGDWMTLKRDEDIFTAIAASCTKIMYVGTATSTASLASTDLATLAYFVKLHAYAKATADPKIPPLKISQINRKTVYRYVGLMHDYVGYDLRVNDTNYLTVVENADVRGNDNKVFTGALIDYQGMILYEHSSCPTATTWGAAGTVHGAESYLLGRQAVVVGVGGYKMKTGKNGYLKMVEETFDYQNQYGVAIGIIKGETKASYNSKDFSVVALRSAVTDLT